MTTELNRTEEQIKELVELEEVLCCLDQHATGQTAPGRAYLRFYAELVRLQETELAGWNAEFAGHDGCREIYRCDQAATPYHTTDNDGPCEVYTTDTEKGAHLCDLHIELKAQATDKANAERDEYNRAKARGEDV